jgi:hypothetical protein
MTGQIHIKLHPREAELLKTLRALTGMETNAAVVRWALRNTLNQLKKEKR